MTLDEPFAKTFVHEWIEAWNDHDLDRVLSYYSEEFQLSSPFIAALCSEPSSTLMGKESVRAFWALLLQKYPDRHFQLVDILLCVSTICIYHQTSTGVRVVEWLRFNSDGMVVAASCSYNELPAYVSSAAGNHVITKQFAAGFAREWAEAWNTHDLSRVLSHYTEDFQMTSPLIARISGNESGTLVGKGNVGGYWAKALQKCPDLKFKVHDVLFSVDCICIYYDTVLGLQAVEWLQFNSDGLVVAASGSYNRIPS